MSTYDIIKYASEEGKRISKIKDKKEKEKAYQNALNEIAIKAQTYTYPKKQEYEPISEPIQDPYNPYNRDLETYQSPRDYKPNVMLASNKPQKEVNNVLDTVGYAGEQLMSGAIKGVNSILGGVSKTLANPGSAIDTVLDIPEYLSNQFQKGIYKTIENNNKEFYDTIDKEKIDKVNNKETINFLERNIDGYKGLKDGLNNHPFSNALNNLGDAYFEDNDLMQSQYNQANLNPLEKFIGDAAYGVGNMIPSITIGALTGNPALGKGVMGLGAYGGGMKQALDEGADLEKAFLYGLANAGTEIATEKLVGGIPYLGKGVTDDIATGVVDKMVKNPTAKKLIERGYDVVGEGFEGYLAENIGEFTQDIYKDDRKELSFGERLADVQDDALYSGLVGMATSGVLNAPSYISQDIQSKRNKVDTQIDNELQNMSNEQLVEIEQELDNNSSGNEVNLNDLAEVEQIPLQDEINVVEPTNEFNADEEYLKTKQLLQETQDPVKQKQIDQFLGLLEPLVSKETLLSDDFNVRSNAQRLNAENIQIIANETGWDSNHVKMLTDFSNKNGIVVKADNLQGINGMYIDGEIVINKNTTNPLLTVFTHELTHSLENRQGYQDLQQAVLNHAKTDVLGDVEYTIQEDIQDIINARYEFDGYEMSQEEAMQEFVAQYIEENIDSETFINEISNNKPLLQRIIDWLSDVIKSFTGTPQEKAYIDLKNKYIKALNGEVITDSNTRLNVQKKLNNGNIFPSQLEGVKYTIKNKNIRKTTLLKNIPNLDTKIDNLTETLLNYDDADFKKLVLDSTKEIYLNGDISQDLKGMMVDYVVDNAKVYDDIESTLYKDEFGEHQVRQHTKENINKYINDIKTSIKYKDNIIQKSPQGQQTIGDAYTDSVKAVKDLALQDSDVYINDIKPLIDEGDYIDSKESENATEYINDVHTIALGGKNRGALNKTIEQNGDAVANGNQEVRHAWKNIFEIPLFTAKGKYSNNTIKNLDLVYSKIVNELGIKKGSKEDSAIMWYGEGERIKQDTNVKSKKIEFEPYTLNDLKRDFPKTWQNVVEAEKVMRAIYDDYVVRLNEESLSKIYSDESIKNEIATKKRKINNEIEHNRKLLQQELKKPIADRNIKYVESLNNQIKKLSYQFNNVETDVMTGKRLKPRKNYFRHYQEMSTAESIKALFDSESRANISNKLAGISEFTKPYTRWESFMQPRNKGRYKESALGGMIQYIPRAEYKIYIDPVTAYNRGVIKDIVEISDANGIDNTVMINWLSNFTNDLAGKTNPIDRAVSHIEGGRKFVQLLKKLNKYPKINAVVGNLSSAVSQFYNFPNVTALLKKQGGMKFTQDLNQGAKLFWADAYHDRELMQSSPFLTERFMDSHISQFDEGLLHKPKQLAEFITAFGDDTIAKYGWYSAYAQALRLNVDNPIYYADALTRRAVAGRGVGEVALAQKSELTKLLGPFQVEVNNTWQLVKALATDGTKDIYRAGKTLAEGVKKGNLKETMPKVKASLGGAEKELGSLFMLFLVTFFMNEVTEPITGRRVGFDTIGDIEDAIESKNPMRVVGGVIKNMPLGAPVAMLTMQDYERERLFGDSDPTRYGVGNIGLTAFTTPLSQYARGEEVDLLKPFSQFGVPYGGRQFEKTYKYLQDIGMFPTATVIKRENSIFPKFEFGWADEGAYTKDGRLKYVIDTDNPFDVAQGLAFGSYATDEGKKYLEKTTPLSQTKTSIVEDFTEFGMKKSDAFELMKNLEKENIIGLDGEKLKLSMATLNRQAFEESGVFDDIVELIDKGKYEPKDFGLNKTIVYDDDKYYEILKEIEEIQSQGYEEVENSMIKDFEDWLNSK
jgi:hypothetical protein